MTVLKIDFNKSSLEMVPYFSGSFPWVIRLTKEHYFLQKDLLLQHFSSFQRENNFFRLFEGHGL